MIALAWLALAGCTGKDAPDPTDDTATGDTSPDPQPASDRDADGFADDADCAPDDPAIHPGAAELCDGIDNDCDSALDEGWDGDGDGAFHDDPDCLATYGEVDCNDRDATIHPGAAEVCNQLDDDCSGQVDDLPDLDADGFTSCSDCDDTRAEIHPGALDICDGLDNDCSGAADETDDADGDGASACGGDCDDADPLNSPLIPERCDGQDNNCDGVADEGFEEDGDGWTTCRGDCDDTNAAVNPDTEEVCDGADNDCDPLTSDDGDVDGDGYTRCTGDCNDLVAAAHPGGTEVCDGADDDCNGATDELPECYGCAENGDYLMCTGYADWPTAEANCEAFGRQLAHIDDEAENTVVTDIIYYTVYTNAWIGANDRTTEGTFTWADGSALTYTSWYSGEPNDYGGNEDCAGAVYGSITAWNDFPCTSYTMPFICE